MLVRLSVLLGLGLLIASATPPPVRSDVVVTDDGNAWVGRNVRAEDGHIALDTAAGPRRWPFASVRWAFRHPGVLSLYQAALVAQQAGQPRSVVVHLLERSLLQEPATQASVRRLLQALSPDPAAGPGQTASLRRRTSVDVVVAGEVSSQDGFQDYSSGGVAGAVIVPRFSTTRIGTSGTVWGN